ncbi:hypothetical protein NMG60_11035586 [Bertholletia excelsa]
MAKTKRICTILLRFLAFASTTVAAIIMATSHQKTSLLSISLEAKYNHTPAFKYFVIANAIGGVYSFLVVFLPSKSLLWRLVVALDVMMAMVLTSSTSAALAVAYTGKKGNSYAGWLPICGQVEKYCHQVGGALALGFVGVIIYLMLLLYSIHAALNPLLL